MKKPSVSTEGCAHSDSLSQIAHPAITTEITTMSESGEIDESITRVDMAQVSRERSGSSTLETAVSGFELVADRPT